LLSLLPKKYNQAGMLFLTAASCPKKYFYTPPPPPKKNKKKNTQQTFVLQTQNSVSFVLHTQKSTQKSWQKGGKKGVKKLEKSTLPYTQHTC
jgi:hypothetical protein